MPYPTQVAFLVSPALSYVRISLDIYTCARILEIQVLLCELIGNLSFTLPADSDNIVRPKYAGSLMPTLSSGEKGLMLRVNKIG
jgi:hypothetical protein